MNNTNKKAIVLTAGVLSGLALAAYAAMNTPKKREKRFAERHRTQTQRECRQGGAC